MLRLERKDKSGRRNAGAGLLRAGTLMLALAAPAQAQDLTVLRLNTFPNATNLALHMGIANGVFEKRGIRIDLRFTQNSEAQRNGLAKGEFEIAYSAVDNAVAMVELAKHDVIIVAGGDGSMNEFMIDLAGPYQGGGIFVMREWARANGPLLERFLAAYVEATRMALAPANRAQAISLIAGRLKQDPAVAERTYDEALTKPGGLAPDAKFDLEGFKAVLQLRAEIEGQWNGKPPAPERYIDLGYYERAQKLAGVR